jgi:hypothetical protein
MITANKISFLVGAIFITSLAIAQKQENKQTASSPIPVEIMVGNNRLVTQFTINRKFAGSNRLGLLAAIYTAADYGNVKSEHESMNVIVINYEILKGFGLVSGVALNAIWGFRPYSGFLYLYAKKQFVAMVLPGFYLTESHNFEGIGFAEYQPHLKNDWSIYSRLDGLYNLDMDTKKHGRTYIHGRLGFNYKTFGFGFAVNYDWYGSLKVYKGNVGVFLRTVFR